MREGRILAPVVVGAGVRHLDGVGADRLGGLRHRHDLAGREDLDLEVAVGHRLDVLGEGLGGAVDGVERAREARGQPPLHLRLASGPAPAPPARVAAPPPAAPFRKLRLFIASPPCWSRFSRHWSVQVEIQLGRRQAESPPASGIASPSSAAPPRPGRASARRRSSRSPISGQKIMIATSTSCNAIQGSAPQ